MNLALYLCKTSLSLSETRLRPSIVALRASYEVELAEVLTILVPDNSHLGEDFLTVKWDTFSPDQLLRCSLNCQMPFPVLSHHIENIPLQESLT